MADGLSVSVDFLADGRCVVRTAASGDGSPPSGGGFRCPLPAAEWRGQPIALRVTLPPGADRGRDEFPQMRWTRAEQQWVGTASLPAPPAFVRVPQSSSAAVSPAAASFGWNFYGFFVFSAAFIATYFLWAWWMRAR